MCYVFMPEDEFAHSMIQVNVLLDYGNKN